MIPYDEFLLNKAVFATSHGFEPAPCPEIFRPHQKDATHWAIRGGRRALFLAFGLGKTFVQLDIARQVCQHTGGRFLIVAPLGVRLEFIADAQKLGLSITFARRTEECQEPGIYLTNYESVRDGKILPHHFDGASLDEASVLRGFGGTKTFREFMRLFEGVRYKFVATATPSPNDFIELLAYAAFLEVMDVGEAKTRFFKRDSTNADNLTIHPHKEAEFWLWCASWALFLSKPSDLGHSDEGYSLPDLDVRWHCVPTVNDMETLEVSGQHRMFKRAAVSLSEAAREKRDSLPARIAKLMEIRAEDPTAHRIIWHDLERERAALETHFPAIRTVWGSQDMDEREDTIASFSAGDIQELGAKPVMCGSGCNFQRHCWWEVFLGIGFKFNDFIQAIHRVHRFLQTHQVRIDIIYTEAETEVRRNLEQKWEKHKELTAKMSQIIKEYGLAETSLALAMRRSLGVDRVEVSGRNYRAVNNDCVVETKRMDTESVHLVLTSIPFSTQYEYTPSYNDFGHTDSNDHFFEQMDYLTPELLRVLKPGRIACIHVKDRIVPGGINKLGFQTVYPFHMQVTSHMMRHGFAYMGMKTIVTDVVRENNQTYRLGWSEQCKDGTKMGVGMPEYLLIFRKPPSDTSNSYADDMVAKSKPLCVDELGELVPFDRNLGIKPGTGYSRSRWQIDAHGFARSSGDTLLTPEHIESLQHNQIFKLYRDFSLHNIYDFEHHVSLCESLEGKMRLPVTFMLLQPTSWSPEVWTDVARMLSLNGAQSAKGREMHLCPMQFDIADRAIVQYTQPGEVVYDPFGGLMTVPVRAVRLGRFGVGCELNSRYFLDGCGYLKA
jgi:DNA modification methylase